MRSFTGYLKGVNLGGWLSQYDEDTKEHFDTFITEKDIANIKSMGFDHVRVPVDYPVIETEDGDAVEEGFAYLKNVHSWCVKNGLNMIIDLHKAYGYSFDPLDDTDKEVFFFDKDIQNRFYATWKRIASYFADSSDSVAFELLNEVTSAEVWKEWNGVICEAVKAIRSVAKDNYIIYGGVMYNSVVSVPQLVNPGDNRVVYNFHCYEPLIITHQGAYWVENMPSDFRIGYPVSLEECRKASYEISHDLAGAIYDERLKGLGPDFFEMLFEGALKKAEEDDVPLYCGEFGVIDLADDYVKVAWTKDITSVLNKYGIGHAYWNYKEKDFGIINIENAEARNELIKSLT